VSLTASGVEITDDCINQYEELELCYAHRYIVYKLSDDLKRLVVEKKATAMASYADFLRELPDNDSRYAVYDFAYDAGDGTRSKILFLFWVPESAKIKAKIMYGATKNAFRMKLFGVGKEITAGDLSELALDKVTALALRA
jgi:cofilin